MPIRISIAVCICAFLVTWGHADIIVDQANASGGTQLNLFTGTLDSSNNSFEAPESGVFFASDLPSLVNTPPQQPLNFGYSFTAGTNGGDFSNVQAGAFFSQYDSQGISGFASTAAIVSLLNDQIRNAEVFASVSIPFTVSAPEQFVLQTSIGTSNTGGSKAAVFIDDETVPNGTLRLAQTDIGTETFTGTLLPGHSYFLDAVSTSQPEIQGPSGGIVETLAGESSYVFSFTVPEPCSMMLLCSCASFLMLRRRSA